MSKFRIAHGATWWDLTKLVPDSFLKGGALNIQGQLDPSLRRSNKGNDPLDDGREIRAALNEISFREPLPNLGGQGFRIVAEFDCTDSAIGRRHDDPTEKTRSDAVANGQSFTPFRWAVYQPVMLFSSDSHAAHTAASSLGR